jgi:hypothetical protein
MIAAMLNALNPASFMTRLLGREDRVQPPPAGIRRLWSLAVRSGRLRELPRWQGRMVVHCRSGEVWLTHDGDPRDVVLKKDQSHVVDSKGRMRAFAVRGDATLELQTDF